MKSKKVSLEEIFLELTETEKNKGEETMTAVYKRELRSYLTSMIGYLFIFFVLMVTGVYFSAYQLTAAYPKFEYTLMHSRLYF